ncbi:hypothetical protein C8J56DRAFT_890386 [Mycena floridula]|nr:hypothetical protein C8J56DRAFT_890386 [Mycena floridula]
MAADWALTICINVITTVHIGGYHGCGHLYFRKQCFLTITSVVMIGIAFNLILIRVERNREAELKEHNVAPNFSSLRFSSSPHRSSEEPDNIERVGVHPELVSDISRASRAIQEKV